MSLQELLQRIQATSGCRVDEPSGLPLIEHPHQLPPDVRAFYQLCGGVYLGGQGRSPVRIVPPTQCLLANPVILGRRSEEARQDSGDDISWSWYIIAQDENGDYLSIDFDQQRLGRCYDSFHETHGLVGDTPIIARSFTELLTRLYEYRGQRWYWLDPHFPPLGDAYDEVF
jgi:hypothetical protein